MLKFLPKWFWPTIAILAILYGIVTTDMIRDLNAKLWRVRQVYPEAVFSIYPATN